MSSWEVCVILTYVEHVNNMIDITCNHVYVYKQLSVDRSGFHNCILFQQSREAAAITQPYSLISEASSCHFIIFHWKEV